MNNDNVTVTKRDIIFSILVIALMFFIGTLIGNKINEHHAKKLETYNDALRIEDQKSFEQAMKDGVEHAFIYGTVNAVGSVSYPEVKGEYLYLKKEKQEYTLHTKTGTDSDGKPTTSTSWEWDTVDYEELGVPDIEILGVTFSVNKIKFPAADKIKTDKKSDKLRYRYYGIETSHKGTIYVDLSSGTIPDRTDLHIGMTPTEYIERDSFNVGIVFFWIMWFFVTGLIVLTIVMEDNEWLNRPFNKNYE